LLNRISFSKEVKKYGDPIEVSANGRSFVFQKEEEPFVLNILSISSEEFSLVKTVDLQASIFKYLD